ncbi:hypothetical protein LJC27_03555 [Christensenellaceae bacterium OttesenSCG-928-M15]|nr:hypothetical protein [Christensenellaceae bacterium OttesenSCG-928-M15]
MKKIGILGFAVIFAISLAACSANNKTPSNTATPIITPETSMTPSGNLGGTGTGGVVGATQTPDATAPNTATPNTATPGNISSAANIPNFKEGTSVLEADVPELMSAFRMKYADHTLSGIKHGLYENEQVYTIDYADAAGKTGIAYYRPNGTWIEDSASSPASSSNAG